jgi:hypothetical protein
MLLGACRLKFDPKRIVFLPALMVVVALGLVACGSSGSSVTLPPSRVTTRVLASQSVASPTAFPGLLIVDGEIDTLVRGGEIGAGSSPGLLAISPNRTLVIAFDSVNNNADVIGTAKEVMAGSIPLGGSTTSMVALDTGFGYAAVPAASFQTGAPPGAIVVLSLTAGGVTALVSVPNAQTVVSSPDGSQLLVFNNSNSVTVMSPLLVNTGNQVKVTVPGFDSPVYGVFSADGSTAYILNCGAQCGGTQASVQVLNMRTTPPSIVGSPILVNGATIGFLSASGSTLYVAGKGTPTGPQCATIASAAPTAAQYCGTLDLVDLTTLQDPYYNNPATEIAITDGYHNRIDMSVNGQLFVGAYGCTNVGDVNNPQGEVRGCLSIYNTTNGKVVIPPDNGDVTGLQSFTTRDVEYVAEGGELRVYDTLIDALIPPNDFIETGTILITGYIIDVKAIDFF